MLATPALRQLRAVPNLVAIGVTLLALAVVMVWAQFPLAGVVTYGTDEGRRLSIRHPVVFTGFGRPDGEGRWTVDDEATISFGRPLPSRFVAVLRGHAYGPNAGRGVRVCARGDCKSVVFSESAHDVRVELVPERTTRRLELHIPQPTAPGGGDERRLGIHLASIRVEPVRE